MMRIPLLILALAAPFMFPWKFSIILAFAVSLVVPWSGIATGLVADALYYNPAISVMPWATFVCICAALLAYGVRVFTKTRIIGG